MKKMKTIKIEKGINLCLYHTEGFKTSKASINIAMPLGDDEAPQRALLLYLLTRTNRDYPTLKAMKMKQYMLYGASIIPFVVKMGESQILRITLDCIDDKFSLADESIFESSLSLLLDLIFKPNMIEGRFNEEDFSTEKRLMVERIQSLVDDKRAYALNRLIEEMCKDEVYSTEKYGTVEQVENITQQMLVTAFANILKCAPIYINAVGNFDEEKVINLVKEKFSLVKREKVQELHTEFLSEAYDEKMIAEKQDVKQCKLVIGMRAGMTYDRDNHPALKVMTDIFGSGTYSKLFMNVREKQSLCYYCSARLDTNKGLILIQSGVEKENVQKAIDAIKYEFSQMQEGNFDDETIKASKISICDMLSSVEDTPDDIESWYSAQQFSSQIYEAEEWKNQIMAVTKEEIIAAANFVTFDTIYVLEPNEVEL